MKKNYGIACILCSVFVFLSGCSNFMDKTGAVSVSFDAASLCRSADSDGVSLTVKLINAASGAVIDTETKTVASSDTQAEISFTAETGLSVYLHAELTLSGTVVASGDSDTVTVKDSTEVPLGMTWKKGSVAVSVTLGTSSADGTLTVELINAETKAVIDTKTETAASSDTQKEMSFSPNLGLSVYLHAELTQSGTVVASGDSDTVTVKDSTEVPLVMQWKKGSVTVSVMLGETPSDSCAFILAVTSPDSAASAVSDSTGITLTAGYAYTISLDAEYLGTAADYTEIGLTLLSGTDPILSSADGTVTVPAYLTDGTYRLYMKACIDGMWYTGYETVVVE
ncbi:MAG: hypothetical protein M0P01_10075 [Treponema sp.]|nr:hypothetical protein [Treponema sp.]